MTTLTAQPLQFSFHESHNVRVQLIDAEPWFCLKDICAVLEIQNSRDLLVKQLDAKGVGKIYTPTTGGNQKLTFVNEPNLYRVIFRSNKPEAKQFQDWVFNEVLPSIRKTGKYESPKHPEPYHSAHEKFSGRDTSNLTRLIWLISSKFRYERSWSKGMWYAIREATGIPSPHPMEVRHIPLIAEECERILRSVKALQEAIADAEKTAIKRILKKREHLDVVIGDITAALADANNISDTVLPAHHKVDFSQFLLRQ